MVKPPVDPAPDWVDAQLEYDKGANCHKNFENFEHVPSCAAKLTREILNVQPFKMEPTEE
jgi:hypothetical protein